MKAEPMFKVLNQQGNIDNMLLQKSMRQIVDRGLIPQKVKSLYLSHLNYFLKRKNAPGREIIDHAIARRFKADGWSQAETALVLALMAEIDGDRVAYGCRIASAAWKTV